MSGTSRVPDALLLLFLAVGVQFSSGIIQETSIPVNMVGCFQKMTTPNLIPSHRMEYCLFQEGVNTIGSLPGGVNITEDHPWFKELQGKLKIQTRRRRGAVPKCQRKEYRYMTVEERNKWHLSVNMLKTDKSVHPNKYDALALLHATNAARTAFGGPSFLAWNRQYYALFEQACHEKMPDLVMPYWDLSLDSHLMDIRESIMWSQDFLGSSEGSVNAGPFSDWHTPYGPLNRQIGNFGSFPSIQTIENILKKEHLGDILYPNAEPDCNLEYLMSSALNVIGGQASSFHSSAVDPAYFLISGYIDYVWSRFQEKQIKKKIIPDDDYPSFYGDSRYAPASPLRIAPITIKEALSPIYGHQRFEYHHLSACGAACKSPHLMCVNQRCVPKTRLPGCSNPLPEKSFQNTFCVDGECDTSLWSYIPVRVVNKRPPNYPSYHSFAVQKGQLVPTKDIYDAESYTTSSKFFKSKTVTRNEPYNCRRSSCCGGVSSVQVTSTGMNYHGTYKDYALVDERLAVATGETYVAVKNPKHGSSQAVVRAYDSCGRVCRPACRIPGSMPAAYAPCSGVIQLTSQQPFGYGDDLGYAYLNMYDFSADPLLPPSKAESAVYLTFYCNVDLQWPFEDDSFNTMALLSPLFQDQQLLNIHSFPFADPGAPTTACKVSFMCDIPITCSTCRLNGGKAAACNKKCGEYAECIYGQYQHRLCPGGCGFNSKTLQCDPSIKCPKVSRASAVAHAVAGSGGFAHAQASASENGHGAASSDSVFSRAMASSKAVAAASKGVVASSAHSAAEGHGIAKSNAKAAASTSSVHNKVGAQSVAASRGQGKAAAQSKAASLGHGATVVQSKAASAGQGAATAQGKAALAGQGAATSQSKAASAGQGAAASQSKAASADTGTAATESKAVSAGQGASAAQGKAISAGQGAADAHSKASSKGSGAAAAVSKSASAGQGTADSQSKTASHGQGAAAAESAANSRTRRWVAVADTRDAAAAVVSSNRIVEYPANSIVDSHRRVDSQGIFPSRGAVGAESSAESKCCGSAAAESSAVSRGLTAGAAQSKATSKGTGAAKSKAHSRTRRWIAGVAAAAAKSKAASRGNGAAEAKSKATSHGLSAAHAHSKVASQNQGTATAESKANSRTRRWVAVADTRDAAAAAVSSNRIVEYPANSIVDSHREVDFQGAVPSRGAVAAESSAKSSCCGLAAAESAAVSGGRSPNAAKSKATSRGTATANSKAHSRTRRWVAVADTRDAAAAVVSSNRIVDYPANSIVDSHRIVAPQGIVPSRGAVAAESSAKSSCCGLAAAESAAVSGGQTAAQSKATSRGTAAANSKAHSRTRRWIAGVAAAVAKSEAASRGKGAAAAESNAASNGLGAANAKSAAASAGQGSADAKSAANHRTRRWVTVTDTRDAGAAVASSKRIVEYPANSIVDSHRQVDFQGAVPSRGAVASESSAKSSCCGSAAAESAAVSGGGSPNAAKSKATSRGTAAANSKAHSRTRRWVTVTDTRDAGAAVASSKRIVEYPANSIVDSHRQVDFQGAVPSRGAVASESSAKSSCCGSAAAESAAVSGGGSPNAAKSKATSRGTAAANSKAHSRTRRWVTVTDTRDAGAAVASSKRIVEYPANSIVDSHRQVDFQGAVPSRGAVASESSAKSSCCGSAAAESAAVSGGGSPNAAKSKATSRGTAAANSKAHSRSRRWVADVGAASAKSEAASQGNGAAAAESNAALNGLGAASLEQGTGAVGGAADPRWVEVSSNSEASAAAASSNKIRTFQSPSIVDPQSVAASQGTAPSHADINAAPASVAGAAGHYPAHVLSYRKVSTQHRHSEEQLHLIV